VSLQRRARTVAPRRTSAAGPRARNGCGRYTGPWWPWQARCGEPSPCLPSRDTTPLLGRLASIWVHRSMLLCFRRRSTLRDPGARAATRWVDEVNEPSGRNPEREDPSDP